MPVANDVHMTFSMRIILVVAAAFAVGAPTACASERPGDIVGAEGRDPPAPEVRPSCSQPTEERPAGSACVQSVNGRLVEDTTGIPLGLFVTVCGGVCFAGSSDPTGFTVPIGRYVDLSAYVLHVDGRPEHTNVFLRLARASSKVAVLVEPTRVPRLDQRGPSFPETPVATATVLVAGDVRLTLAPNTEVELDLADVALEAEGRVFRSGRVTSEASGDAALIALHALAPFGATLSSKAEVAIRLQPAVVIADGAAVELVALDDDLLSPDVGTLRVIGSGTVMGGVARSDVANGIERLTWVGVRRKANR